MTMAATSTRSFPSVCIQDNPERAPIEINLIAQFGIGEGSALVQGASSRQSQHASFIDALDEPSAKLGGVHPDQGDHSSLYSFVVGPQGHPFHRHAGSRMFTAISGSSGAQLRFSTLGFYGIKQNPEQFGSSLHVVDIPPDCLFSVRFGGGTWHQFASPEPESGHPTLFALSCHPDESSGLKDSTAKGAILQDQASIPSLTEVLPEQAQLSAAKALNRLDQLNRTALFLQPSSSGWCNGICALVRKHLGTVRARIADFFHASGSVLQSFPEIGVQHRKRSNSPLLNEHFSLDQLNHDDSFICELSHPELAGKSAHVLLDELLTNFTVCPPQSVTALMMIRNALVRPFGLRRSRLGCPVSSLKSETSPERFANRHPVLAKQISRDGRFAEVMLGADDRHLRFRSTVSVRLGNDSQVVVSLCSRVACNNLFGRFYMSAIKRTHESFVSPKLLSTAIAGLLSGDAVRLDLQDDNRAPVSQ